MAKHEEDAGGLYLGDWAGKASLSSHSWVGT
jgi:hypothetical protein